MSSIVELADCIILDDVTDVFYRSLCFSNYERAFYDEKSFIEEQFDELISDRLLDKLDWNEETLSATPAVYFICKLLKCLNLDSYNASALTSLLEEHSRVFDDIDKNEKLKKEFEQSINSAQEPTELYPIIWRFFEASLHGHNKHMLQQVSEFSEQIVQTSLTSIDAIQHTNHLPQLKKLALLNALPMVILLLLLDNEIALVNNELAVHEADKVIEPCAETVLSFLVFDEFLKPHLLEHIDQEQYCTWLKLQSGQIDELSKVFLEARTKVILEALSGEFILTAQQKRKFSEQVGSKFKICSQISNVAEHRTFWRNLLNVPA